jgi:hypothetical protein|nr:MAG TPA: hypothetical protein [Caudoviricetes sp.]
MNGLELIGYVCKSVIFLVTGMILIIAYAEWSSRR